MSGVITFNGDLVYEDFHQDDFISDTDIENSIELTDINGNGVHGGEGELSESVMPDRPPSSAQSRADRAERLKLLKERQNDERIRKLEELKQHALQAAKLREEQDIRRKKHFEEFGKKEDDKRRQAEERRRQLEEDRKQSLQTKWETKKQLLLNSRPPSSKPSFAFGSCTPRLVDNHVDGALWKSQYNINGQTSGGSSSNRVEQGIKSTSAQDLHTSSLNKMSMSMYEWDQQRTTFNRDTIASRYRRNCNRIDAMEPDRVFCGRRKTDLTPTLPIRREDYSAAASRSASRATTSTGNSRVYSSMTRLDSPGSTTRASNKTPLATQPSRSKSTTQLASAGKLTRTEILRQQILAKGTGTTNSKAPGHHRSGSATPSSLMTSSMTSSVHSQVSMRPRTLGARKYRPASVHITGVSADILSPKSATTPPLKSSNTRLGSERNNNGIDAAGPATSRTLTRNKPKVAPEPVVKKTEKPLTRSNHVKSVESSKSSETGKSGTVGAPAVFDSSTVRRAKPSDKKKPAEKKVDKVEILNGTSSPVVDTTEKLETVEKPVEPVAKPVEPVAQPVETEETPNSLKSSEVPEITVIPVENPAERMETPVVSESEPDLMSPTPEPDFVSVIEVKNIENWTQEAAPVTNTDNFNPFEVEADSSIVETTVEPTIVTVDKGVVEESPLAPVIPVAETLLALETPAETQLLAEPDLLVEPSHSDSSRPLTPQPGADAQPTDSRKLLTEEDAKAALAEKRRLAREAQEKEAADLAQALEEEARLEEERQRQEAEEADRLAQEAKAIEALRLERAIQEQEARELEEKKRREEEELQRQERENYEREAAREAERIRIEMEERLKREEEERLERKKRVEAIMSRTRKSGNESNKSTTPVPEDPPSNELGFKPALNGTTNTLEPAVATSNGDQVSSPTPTTPLNNLNIYNNNNDFSNTLIDFGDMGGSTNPTSTPSTTTQSINSNNILQNSLQDLLS